MDNQLEQELELVSAGPLCAPFARRLATELASVRRHLDPAAQERLETDLARLLQQQLTHSPTVPEGPANLRDTLFEVVLRLAPDDGMRH